MSNPVVPSPQVNVKAGELPAADVSGEPFLKVPIGGF
jgi:hypothetical protein